MVNQWCFGLVDNRDINSDIGEMYSIYICHMFKNMCVCVADGIIMDIPSGDQAWQAGKCPMNGSFRSWVCINYTINRVFPASHV